MAPLYSEARYAWIALAVVLAALAWELYETEFIVWFDLVKDFIHVLLVGP
jgi:hypothetical protein